MICQGARQGSPTRERAFLHHQPVSHSEMMMIFKCPYCRTEYEMTTARLSFQQRSYAKCQVCFQTMYSWNSQNVPMFILVNASKGETSDIQP